MRFISIFYSLCISGFLSAQGISPANLQEKRAEHETLLLESTQRVSDFAHFYSPKHEIVLDSMIRDLKMTTGVELRILTLDSTMVSKENFRPLLLKICKSGEWSPVPFSRHGIIAFHLDYGLSDIVWENDENPPFVDPDIMELSQMALKNQLMTNADGKALLSQKVFGSTNDTSAISGNTHDSILNGVRKNIEARLEEFNAEATIGILTPLMDRTIFAMQRTIRNAYMENPPPPTGWVNDFDSLFTAEQGRYLDSFISAFERKTTYEIAVVTLSAFAVEKEQFNTVVRKIANTWGVGKKDKNNGIVIGISKDYKMVRIETANGARKVLTDDKAKKIVDEIMLVYYAKGEYFEGTLLALEEMMKILNTAKK